MERWAVRKRLRKLYRMLLDSRVALDRASEVVRDKWLKDMLFVMACRRLIMMNLLDRELGTLPIRVEPRPGADHHFDGLLSRMEASPQGASAGLLQACQNEEDHLLDELRELRFGAGVGKRTLQILTEMIHEAEENLDDLRFLTNGRSMA
ncbi:MAG: hypothetical protein JNM62_10675 [Flavobacteriales bacterium]|nr:hypothetical protein [Flavobacteriales bacterium]